MISQHPDAEARPTSSRRGFLAGAGISASVVAAAGFGRTPEAAAQEPATATPAEHTPAAQATRATGFAIVTDTHENVDHPELADRLRRVLGHAEARNPAFVLNCGDLTDLGTDDEFALYHGAIPDGLRSRMHQVPGNHEEQWTTDAMEAYKANFGPLHHSFDAQVGTTTLHVVGLDPMVPHEFDYWRFGDELLGWLERDLKAVPKGRPIALFQHFPLVTDYHYVTDEDRFLELIRAYDVRAVFAGHIHKETVSVYNGLTEVTGKAVKNEPYYYWAERIDTDRGAALKVSEVQVPETGDATETVLVTIPLDEPSSGGALGPFAVTGTPSTSALAVTATLPAAGASEATSVLARVYPEGGKPAAWASLAAGSGRTWSGSVDVSSLAPGPHRLEVRAVGSGTAHYAQIEDFALPLGSTRVRWSTALPGRIQGALAERNGLVVAATTQGYVRAFRATPSGARTLWTTHVGPVTKGAVFTEDGALVLVPSADHHLHALDPNSGRALWRADLGAPLQCDIGLVTVDGHPYACVAPGHEVALVDLAGSRAGTAVWRTGINGVFGGRAASDGERIFVGSGDARAYALNARTGAQVWSAATTPRTGDYFTVAYGPWASQVRLLPSGAVLFTTYNDAYALDAATGERRWATDNWQGQLPYTPPTVTEHGILLFNGSNGSAHLLDPATGAETWHAEVLRTSFGAGPIASADPDVFWMVAHQGLLVRIDLVAGTITPVLQVSTAFTYSTGVLVARADTGGRPLIVVGGQDGRIHGVGGLPTG